MRAILRWTILLLAGGLWFAPGLALAQTTGQSPANISPAPTTAVGPSELQNFSLSGTESKPAEQPAAAAPAPSQARARSTPTEPVREASARSSRGPAGDKAAVKAKSNTTTEARPVAQEPAASSPALSQPTQALPTPPAQYSPGTGIPPTVPFAPPSSEGSLSGLPWLGAGLALAGAALFFFWRRRPKEAIVGDAEVEFLAAPEPSPQTPPEIPTPRPAIAPQRKSAAAKGIVSSRLRPAIEIGMQPLRCLVDDDRVTIEFELELFNAGAAPARAVLPEARLLNAGAGQDQELMGFFTNPVGAGERLEAIGPMKRMSFKSQVSAPRTAIQEYELAGRKSFVPLIAFNTLYSWSGGPAQTSAAYLVGRTTKGNKLAPLRLDLGAREFRELDARILPAEVRT